MIRFNTRLLVPLLLIGICPLQSLASATVHVYRLANPNPMVAISIPFYVDGQLYESPLEPMSLLTLKLSAGRHTFSFDLTDTLALTLEEGNTYYLRSRRLTVPYFQHVNKSTARADLSMINPYLSELVKEEDAEMCKQETPFRDDVSVMPGELLFDYRNKMTGGVRYSMYESGPYKIYFLQGTMAADKSIEVKVYFGDELYRLVFPGRRPNNGRGLEVLDYANRVILTIPTDGEKKGQYIYPDGSSFKGDDAQGPVRSYSLNGMPALWVSAKAELNGRVKITWEDLQRNTEVLLVGLDWGGAVIRAGTVDGLTIGTAIARQLLFGLY